MGKKRAAIDFSYSAFNADSKRRPYGNPAGALFFCRQFSRRDDLGDGQAGIPIEQRPIYNPDGSAGIFQAGADHGAAFCAKKHVGLAGPLGFMPKRLEAEKQQLPLRVGQQDRFAMAGTIVAIALPGGQVGKVFGGSKLDADLATGTAAFMMICHPIDPFLTFP
jgi:hypothetical protein